MSLTQENPSADCILVVDDNEDNAFLITRILELKGYKVHTRYGGWEALEAAEHFRPKAVLLDLAMPKLDGYQTGRLLREKAWAQDVLLIAISGHAQDEDRCLSQKVGFDAHLAKPIDYDALFNLLGSLLSHG